MYPALHGWERELLIQGECCTTGNGLHVRFYKLSTAGKRRLAEAEFTWTSVALAFRSAEVGMKSIGCGYLGTTAKYT